MRKIYLCLLKHKECVGKQANLNMISILSFFSEYNMNTFFNFLS